MSSISKLVKEFVAKTLAKASDMNDIVAKVNEVIDASNGSLKGIAQPPAIGTSSVTLIFEQNDGTKRNATIPGAQSDRAGVVCVDDEITVGSTNPVQSMVIQRELDQKQDTLIAGDNITIADDGKTISASGGGDSNVLFMSKADFDKITPSESKLYVVTDGTKKYLYAGATLLASGGSGGNDKFTYTLPFTLS